MPRCNLRHLINDFVHEHWGDYVITKEVYDWIAERCDLKLTRIGLGKRLNKHPKFKFVKRTNKGNLYQIENEFENWLDDLINL